MIYKVVGIQNVNYTSKNLADSSYEIKKSLEKGYLDNHVISWSTVVKHSLDSQKVKALLGKSYDDYLTASSYRKFSVA